LTAEEVLTEALGIQAGETLLVNGAGGITGGLIVQLASLRGAEVIAMCGPGSIERVRGYGARAVIDYHDPPRDGTANGRPMLRRVRASGRQN
jgi:NADPH:quinone reductase-like Zn-dependent oxidoreductase